MESYELQTCSFIVKVWIEETKEETGQTTWRGHITHVSSGVRHYFEDFNRLITVITPYLQKMGVDTEYTASADS